MAIISVQRYLVLGAVVGFGPDFYRVKPRWHPNHVMPPLVGRDRTRTDIHRYLFKVSGLVIHFSYPPRWSGSTVYSVTENRTTGLSLVSGTI